MRIPSPVNDYVARRLKDIRRERNLSAREVAQRAGIASGSYSCIENSFYRVNLDNLLRILMVLDAEIGDVWPKVRVPEGGLSVPDTIRAILERLREEGRSNPSRPQPGKPAEGGRR